MDTKTQFMSRPYLTPAPPQYIPADISADLGGQDPVGSTGSMPPHKPNPTDNQSIPHGLGLEHEGVRSRRCGKFFFFASCLFCFLTLFLFSLSFVGFLVFASALRPPASSPHTRTLHRTAPHPAPHSQWTVMSECGDG